MPTNPSPQAFWKKQRVLVTGGGGFLGSYVVENLRARGCSALFAPRQEERDLRQLRSIEQVLRKSRPTLIIHLAAKCGGIGANQRTPGEFFFDNAIMGIQLMDAARRHGVRKFVQVGTVCAYPRVTRVPFREQDLWNGYPEDTNAAYGLAKKILLVQAQAYRQQYGFNAIYLIPANLYGPRDHFDLQTGHVIPALIRKFIEARRRRLPRVTLWGNGRASRDFLYVEDAAEGILMAAQSYNQSEPCNLGTGEDLTIRRLAAIVRRQTRFTGEIVWDTSKPNGQPMRRLDVQRALKAFNFRASTPLRDGLQRTITWYEEKHARH